MHPLFTPLPPLLLFIMGSVTLVSVALFSLKIDPPNGFFDRIIMASSASPSLSDRMNKKDDQIRFTIFIAVPATPWMRKDSNRSSSNSDGDETGEHRNVVQAHVGAWLELIPSAKVVLLMRRDTLPSDVYINDSRVSVETNIDHNFRGTPQVHSMFARASSSSSSSSSQEQQSPSPLPSPSSYHTHISVLVMDPGFLVSQAFLDGVHKTCLMHQDWVLFSRRPNYSSGGTDDDGKEEDSEDSGEVEYWAWNDANDRRKDVPLFSSSSSSSPMPPFSLVGGTYEHWIIEHLLESGVRVVVDASDGRAPPENAHNLTSSAARYRHYSSSNGKSNLWEPYINAKLSATSSAKRSVAPWKLIRCAEPTLHNLCMVEQPEGKKKEKKTALKEVYAGARFLSSASSSAPHPWKKMGPGIPHSLDELLPQVADDNKVVVMVGGTSNYKEMLLSYICRVQSLGVKSVLVVAFDEELFEFAYLQGLAVYLESSSEDVRPVIGADGQCIFASECFKQVSKLKSSSVLRVLRKGYSVLWGDMDIFWFKNPLPQLRAFGPGTLPIQSDEPDERKPENSIRGANSGFYLARSDERTIRAFRAIVGHAMGTDMTEQPSFYDVLCGVNGEKRVGETQCSLGHDGVRTMFLSHEEYPNGHVFGHWDAPDVSASCKLKGCVILHNNYIQGKGNKIKRFVANGMWFYDMEHRMCIHPWHPMSPTRTPLSHFRDHFLQALNLTML